MKHKLPFFLLVSISILIVFSFYGKVLLHPDSYMFADNGDGLKNYFTYSYHIKHDQTATGFEGMNYPYGEHFMYTDCHPVIATLLKTISGHEGYLAEHSVGILNFLMIISIFLTFVMVFLLLVELGVNRWFSLLFSIGITLLAPQIFRLGGHLALSYSVAIPLSWLLILKYLKNPRRFLITILVFLNNIFWFFIHAYLGMIITFFLMLILVLHFVADRERKKNLRQTLPMLFALLAPVILFFLFIKFTDTHSGRTENPSGFFQYMAEADDIFIPNHPPLRPLLDSLTGNAINLQWEAWSYVGISTTLLILCFVFMGIYRLIKRRRTVLNGFFDTRIVNISLIAAFLMLLFAMAIPFRQFPSLADLIPFMKQFRALGRFTWPFYFVATIFTATVISKIYENANSRKGRNIAIGLAFIAGFANIAEAIPYHKEMSFTITQTSNLFQRKNLSNQINSAIETINSSEYQAIISLPFFYQGSESYSRPQNGETVRSSIILSYHTGLPMVCANLTRTSIPESKNIVQLVSPDFYPKRIETDLPDPRPFLVIRTSDHLTVYEEALFRKCKPVYKNDQISLFRLEKEDIFKSSAPLVIAEFLNKKAVLKRKDNFYLSDSSFIFYNGFEQQTSEHPFRGKGGFASVKKNKNVLAEFNPWTFEQGKQYHVSAWMYNGLPDALNLYFRFIVEEYDEAADVWESTTFFPDQSETINGDWSLAEGVFTVKNPKNRIYIVTIGTKDAKGPLYIDDLLVRETGVDVYDINTGNNRLFFNNHDVQIR